ncbi:siderophore-interacting protein [Bartonella sp. HY329]|uniref:siderophore-interacting protein n=1 Tax=unclassified Bartonella TaxID=2645622 RepID=UPI0021C6FBA3|nr:MULTISPECIES: siderophore-interacting protein [unclassified Bartonella]UXM94463.1 siderophore-interacting protein [Bartonella sp. HY329]UXN08787.1 siderophore-interacting protein [Bartonella sp. HY328]
MSFQISTTVQVNNFAAIIAELIDHMGALQAKYHVEGNQHHFDIGFGKICFQVESQKCSIFLSAEDEICLARIKDLTVTSFAYFTKQEAQEFIWAGDQLDETSLEQFRVLEVENIFHLSPHMLRVRLTGENLKRFSLFGSMHAKLLFPAHEGFDPVWPIRGKNGLPHWLDDKNKPISRSYTIRNLNIEAGWLEIDFYIHETDGISCRWAQNAQIGDKIGILGPVGRPIPNVGHYILGADPTGLPALGRILENLPDTATGHAIITIDELADKQDIKHPKGINIEWIISQDQIAAAKTLTQKLQNFTWPEHDDVYAWFAGEASQAKILREYWRDTLKKGRDKVLASAYWTLNEK